MDLVPPLPQTQERVLHQLLRIVAVPGHEVQRLEQAFVLLLEEGVEAGPCLDALRGERHDDLTLCSHDPWMHEGSLPLTAMVAQPDRKGNPSRGYGTLEKEVRS